VFTADRVENTIEQPSQGLTCTLCQRACLGPLAGATALQGAAFAPDGAVSLGPGVERAFGMHAPPADCRAQPKVGASSLGNTYNALGIEYGPLFAHITQSIGNTIPTWENNASLMIVRPSRLQKPQHHKTGLLQASCVHRAPHVPQVKAQAPAHRVGPPAGEESARQAQAMPH